jgi:predicted nucleic acid-binding Zn ribbon protein
MSQVVKRKCIVCGHSITTENKEFCLECDLSLGSNTRVSKGHKTKEAVIKSMNSIDVLNAKAIIEKENKNPLLDFQIVMPTPPKKISKPLIIEKKKVEIKEEDLEEKKSQKTYKPLFPTKRLK